MAEAPHPVTPGQLELFAKALAVVNDPDLLDDSDINDLIEAGYIVEFFEEGDDAGP